MVRSLVEKFERTGSVNDEVAVRKTKERTARTPELVELVDRMITDEPKLSTRKIASITGASRATVMRVLKKDLKKFPYKIQTAQRLSESAIQRRMFFASDMCEMIDNGRIDINKIIFSDEAHFWLDGYVNKQNFRIWGSEKPQFLETKPLHPTKITVWAALSSRGLIGPIFIEESVDSDVYEGILNDYFIPAARQLGWMDRDWWFQQDGAPPHTTRGNLEIIQRHFGPRVLAHRYPEIFDEGQIWPPYSPDLSPLDFFLWGCIKDKVYKKSPKTLQELRIAISRAFETIPADMLSRAIGSFENRLRMLIVVEGAHIENIIH